MCSLFASRTKAGCRETMPHCFFFSKKEKQITSRVCPQLCISLFHSVSSLPFLCSTSNITGVQNGENKVLQGDFQHTKSVSIKNQLLHFRKHIKAKKIETEFPE